MILKVKITYSYEMLLYLRIQCQLYFPMKGDKVPSSLDISSAVEMRTTSVTVILHSLAQNSVLEWLESSVKVHSIAT